MAEEHALIGMEYEIEVRDKDGKVTERQKGEHSLLIQCIATIIECLTPSGITMVPTPADVKSIGGTATNPYLYQYSSSAYCGIPSAGALGSITQGIVVGSGNTPVTADDYKLATIIASGVGTLQYSAGVVNDVTIAAPRANCRIDRQFLNGSGGAIVVKEIGIYSVWYDGAVGNQICWCRDVLASPVSVPNGSTLYVKYTVYISV